jgi:ATP-dependent helicase/nuclease subunit A
MTHLPRPSEVTDVDDDISLTTEQEDALVLDRNVAITAGAGTGKTTTLTARYLALLDANPGIGPENIVTITFTRKAAAELRTRVREDIYDRLEDAEETGASYERWRDVLDEIDNGYIHTIHAFCARLLREYSIEAPVPFGFDVLDEDGAADLQREIVVDFLDTEQDDSDVVTLSRLWNHGRLADVLVGLLNERPDSTEWVEHWRDASVEEYMDFLRREVCDLDGDTARSMLTDPAVEDALDTINRLANADLAVDDDVDGMRLLGNLASAVEPLPASQAQADGDTCQQVVAELYRTLQKQSGGLYGSASWHIIGKKADWESATDAYSDLKNAVNTILDALDAHEDALETIPGELERNSAHYVLALARIFDEVRHEYAAAKERQNALDYPDLIATTIEFLETNDAVRADLRSKFAAVMVDEFQDTDPRQWRLVKLLTDLETDADHVFLVGDEKQSIYGFRGADVTTFGTARRELSATNAAQGLDALPEGNATDPTALELSGNFRSLQTTLDVVDAVFEQLFQAEDDDHAPYEARPQSLSFERDRVEDVASLEGSVEYLLVPDDPEVAAELLEDKNPVPDAAAEHASEAEAQALAARLTHLFADPPQIQDPDDGEHREATPSDVAILLRRRTHLDRYQRALNEYDIPYTVVSGTGFYDTYEVRTLVNLLRVLADPDDDISLYGVLRSPLFGFTDDRLAPITADSDSLWEALETTDDPPLADAYELLTTWRTLAGVDDAGEAGVLPWGRLLTRIIDDTGYLMSVSADEHGQQAVANVEKFREQLRTWSEGGVRTAASLLHRIDREAELDVREGEAEIPEGAEGVRLMTIHAAKGLEFPVVVVPDLGSKLNYGRSIDDHGHVRLTNEADGVPPLLAVKSPSPNDVYSLEATVAHRYAKVQSLPRERAEAKRLLYVACTRARDHLLLCGTHDITQAEDGEYVLGETEAFDEAERWRDWLQPLLLDRDAVLDRLFSEQEVSAEIRDANYTVRLPPEPTTLDAATSESDAYPEIEIPTTTPPAQGVRVTASNVVDAVAESHTERDENGSSRTSEAPSEELPANVFGTVVHKLAELRPTDREWDDIARRVAGIEGHSLTDDDRSRVRRHARDAIDYVDQFEADHDVQRTYDELSVITRLDNHRIVGDIDHLTVTPQTYHITDYKTNNTTYQSTTDLADHYHPQMLCYALALLQHDPSREVRANLRFTDAGVTERFEWGSEEQSAVRSNVHSLINRLDM